MKKIISSFIFCLCVNVAFANSLEMVEQSLNKIAQKASLATVRVQFQQAELSGVIVSAQGHILTIKSSLSRGRDVNVLTPQGETYEAKVIKTWPLKSLALIKVGASSLDFVPLGKSQNVKIGDQVISLGNAFGSARGRRTRSGAHYGIISGRRKIRSPDFYFSGDIFLTDARINPGSEGGPVLDINGHLIGINNRAVVAQETNAPLNIILPIDEVINELAEIFQLPFADREPDSVLVLDRQFLGAGGVRVLEVQGLSNQADIQTGDLITELDGQLIDNVASFDKLLAQQSANHLIPLSIYRNGKFLKRFLTFRRNAPVEALLVSQAYRQALAKVAPSVVKIHVNRRGRGAQLDVNLLPSDQAFQLGNGPFTGLIYRSDGYILTSSFNLAGDIRSVLVELHDGRKFPAQILGRDLGRNITLLHIDCFDLPQIEPARSDQVVVGSTVLSLGSTYASRGLPTIDRGIVSALNRSAGKAIQIDANLNPGNFGGPTIDLYGRVLGVNIPQANLGEQTLRQATAGGEFSGSGIGFVIPLWDIDNLFYDLKAGKRLEPAFLGIRFNNDIDIEGAQIEEVIREVGILKPGVSSQQLRKAASNLEDYKKLFLMRLTGATQAGLLPGDVIKEFNGKPIPSWNILLNSIGRLNAGHSVIFKIDRAGTILTIKATLGPRGQIFP